MTMPSKEKKVEILKVNAPCDGIVYLHWYKQKGKSEKKPDEYLIIFISSCLDQKDEVRRWIELKKG